MSYNQSIITQQKKEKSPMNRRFQVDGSRQLKKYPAENSDQSMI
jgi:hypothetical protein